MGKVGTIYKAKNAGKGPLKFVIKSLPSNILDTPIFLVTNFVQLILEHQGRRTTKDISKSNL